MISRWRGSSRPNMGTGQVSRASGSRVGQGWAEGGRGGEGGGGEGPRLVPADPVLVHEQPHQLGYRQHRMGVVELDDDLVREFPPVAVAEPEPADDVPQ